MQSKLLHVIVDDERKDKRGSKTFYINMIIVYCGFGNSALEKYCGMMNMPQPVAKPSYTALTKKLKKAAQITAEKSMSAAANDAKEKESTADIGVSVDGTWQRRGYASLNGVIAANSKVVDVETVSRCCKACQSEESLRGVNKEKFEEWKKDHEKDCQANYSGSAPGMETEGAIRIFGRLVQKHGAYYLKYNGDGDSKSYEKDAEYLQREACHKVRVRLRSREVFGNLLPKVYIVVVKSLN